jgi:hypothetical protein
MVKYTFLLFIIIATTTTFLVVKSSPTELPYIQECCQESILSDATILLNCVHNASTYHFFDQSIPSSSDIITINGVKSLSTLTQSRLDQLRLNRVVRSKFAFITFGDQKIASYSAFSFSVNEAFAEYNGYVLMLAQPDYTNPSNHDTRDVRWNKVKIMETAIGLYVYA